MTGKEAEVWLSAMTHLVHGKDREALLIGLDALKSALYDDSPAPGAVAMRRLIDTATEYETATENLRMVGTKACEELQRQAHAELTECLAAIRALPAPEGQEDLRAALADVARLDQYRIRLGAWHSVFGTTQLTHAQARLEKAEADVARLTEERDRTTKALRRADSMLTAVRRIAENYHDVDATGDPLIWKACNPCAAEILNALEGRNDAG